MEKNLKRIIVLYGTKYGSTKRYAEWIAEKTDAEICELSAFDQSLLQEYAVVLFGSPVYMGKIKYRSFVKRNWRALSSKKVIIFGVTGIPPDDPRQKRVLQTSLPSKMREKITYYPLRGAFNYKELSFTDKLLMSGPQIRLRAECCIKKSNRAKELLARFYSPLDWTDKAAIEPIVTLVNS
jgi:menaquinone-dependent protoporphyrinogen IX oxidase